MQVADRLGASVDAHAWDGAWYRRAYFDDGTPLGSHESAECRIDAIAQSWAVISGLGDPDRATRALSESERLLVRESERLMLLLWPPFEKEGADPGYIRAYPPGIRENGGQYTHGVLWTAQALALAGEGDRAAHLFALLNPIRHADGTEAVARYKVEPYVVAADVYGADPHLGRGGWTWYTGSASWMYRIAVEDMLGVRREGARLIVDPSIPRSWAAFEIDYRVGSTLYAIRVENPFGVSTGVRRVEIDGRVSSDHGIPLVDDGRRREIRVSLGRDQGLGGGASPPERPPASAMSMHGASK